MRRLIFNKVMFEIQISKSETNAYIKCKIKGLEHSNFEFRALDLAVF